jgi:hypothetical protein
MTLASHVDFASYTGSEGRYSPKNVHAGGMLKYPLRELDTDNGPTSLSPQLSPAVVKRYLIMDTTLT